MQSSWQTTWYARTLVLVSFADVLIHAVSQQFELTRALVALVLVLWVQAWSQRRWVGWSVVVLYVLVNGWFIGQAGLVNPDTGAPRIVWLLIVGTTLALCGMCLYQQSRR